MIKFFFSIVLISFVVFIFSKIIEVKSYEGKMCFSLKEEVRYNLMKIGDFKSDSSDEDVYRSDGRGERRVRKIFVENEREGEGGKSVSMEHKEKSSNRKESSSDKSDDVNKSDDVKETSQRTEETKQSFKKESAKEDPIEEIIRRNF